MTATVARAAAVMVTVIISASATFALPAAAHEAHVHGVGKLDVAIDGARLTLHLDTPLANLLGFEHAPRTGAERQATQAMSRQLRQPAALFVTDPAALCTPLPVTLVATALTPALLDPDGAGTVATATAASGPAKAAGKAPASKVAATVATEHADLDADFAFHCGRPALLRTLRVTLFERFPGFHRINAQIVTPQKQSAATLEPGAAAIPF